VGAASCAGKACAELAAGASSWVAASGAEASAEARASSKVAASAAAASAAPGWGAEGAEGEPGLRDGGWAAGAEPWWVRRAGWAVVAMRTAMERAWRGKEAPASKGF